MPTERKALLVPIDDRDDDMVAFASCFAPTYGAFKFSVPKAKSQSPSKSTFQNMINGSLFEYEYRGYI